MSEKTMKYLLACGTLILGLVLVARVLWAADDDEAAPAPTTAPATQPAKVSDDARQLLDQISAAYGKLHALDLTGTITVQLQVEGSELETHSASFTSAFVAPNRFRHEVKDDVLIGSTGRMLYTFQSEANAYTQAEAPKDKVASKELPKAIASLLGMQDPSLMLAISKNPADELLSDVTDATRTDDTKVDGVSCPTLKLVQKDKTIVLVMADPQTRLLRELRADLTAGFRQRRDDLTQSVVTIAYTKTSPDAAENDQFAWSPPPGARDADAMATARPLDETKASSLEGKAAPQFKLMSLEGKPVSLADANGKVVVLDFWATWCGPCRMALPHINQLYNDMKDKGLLVYAVNQQEDKQDVQDFVTETKLALPVLLDSDNKVSDQYGADSIPETVVIGKDGIVKKVIIGVGPGDTEVLKQAIDAAMKG